MKIFFYQINIALVSINVFQKHQKNNTNLRLLINSAFINAYKINKIGEVLFLTSHLREYFLQQQKQKKQFLLIKIKNYNFDHYVVKEREIKKTLLNNPNKKA